MADDITCDCGKGDDPAIDLKEHAESCCRRQAFNPDTFAGIMMTSQRAMCGLHAMPFRDEWPKGSLIFMVKGFSGLTTVPGIWEEARRLAELGPEVAEVPVKMLERVLDVKPLCCRLPRAKLVEVYSGCGVGVKKRCKTCGVKRLGTNIETQQQGNIGHVCFECMAVASTTPFRD